MQPLHLHQTASSFERAHPPVDVTPRAVKLVRNHLRMHPTHQVCSTPLREVLDHRDEIVVRHWPSPPKS